MQQNTSGKQVGSLGAERETRTPRVNGTQLNLSPLAQQVLTFDEIASLGRMTEIPVRPNFTTDALNDLNRALFALPADTAFGGSGLSPFFVEIPSVQLALVHAIESHLTHRGRKPIRVLEIAAGVRNRWRHLTQTRSRFDVTLTDFAPHILPLNAEREVGSNITLTTGAYDLNQNLQVSHADGGRFDVVLGTYAFDSVWLPGDRRYVKTKNGQWHVSSYRINVPDYFDAQEKAAVLVALRTGVWENTEGLSLLGLLKKLEIAERLEPVDMQQVPFGQEILQRYDNLTTVEINFPGGLIQRVQEAFETTIASGGIFVIGDVAVINDQCYTELSGSSNHQLTRQYIKGYYTSGSAEKYNVQDFGLAKQILEAQGFRVSIYNAREYAMRFADREQRNQLQVEGNQYIMVVSK